MRSTLLLPLLGALACAPTRLVNEVGQDGGAPPASDAGTLDASTPDAGSPDAGNSDAGTGRRCGTPVDAGSPVCDAGQCIVELATDPGNPYAIAVSSTDVYWTDYPGDDVMMVPINGGSVVTIATGQNNPSSIAVDCSDVYWISAGNGTVVKEPLQGGVISTMASGQSGAFAIAVDTTSVYWTTASAIIKMPLAGGAFTTLASGSGTVDYAAFLALDATSVYWDNYAGTGVLRVGLDGSGLTTLAGTPDPWGAALSGDSLYFEAGYQIESVPTAGGSVSTLASTGCEWGLTADLANIYWFTCSDLVQEPIEGGAITTVSSIPSNGGGIRIEVDSNSIYWTEGYSPGSVMRATPK